jgi:hypothetical protein
VRITGVDEVRTERHEDQHRVNTSGGSNPEIPDDDDHEENRGLSSTFFNGLLTTG